MGVSHIPIATADPGDDLPYQIDWAEAFLLPGESIASFAWTVPDPPDAALETHDPAELAGVTTLWVRGGTAGQEYRLRCAIVTSTGRRKARSIHLQVRVE